VRIHSKKSVKALAAYLPRRRPPTRRSSMTASASYARSDIRLCKIIFSRSPVLSIYDFATNFYVWLAVEKREIVKASGETIEVARFAIAALSWGAFGYLQEIARSAVKTQHESADVLLLARNFRARAEQGLVLAENLYSPKTRQTMRGVAATYEKLAQQLERHAADGTMIESS
jgi:hypothetical protein